MPWWSNKPGQADELQQGYQGLRAGGVLQPSLNPQARCPDQDQAPGASPSPRYIPSPSTSSRPGQDQDQAYQAYRQDSGPDLNTRFPDPHEGHINPENR